MGRSIRDYVSKGADISYEQLTARFGDPKQIASTYVMEMDAEELLTSFKNGKRLIGAAVITSVIMISMWLGFLFVCHEDVEKDVNGYLIVEEVVVENRTLLND